MRDHPIEELLGALPDQVRPDDAFDARLRARLAAELTADPGSATGTAMAGTPPETEVMELDTMTKVPGPPARTSGRWLLVAAAAAIVGILAAVTVIDGDDASEVELGSERTVFDDGFDDDSSGWITEQTTGITVETGGGRQTWRLSAAGASDVQRPLTAARAGARHGGGRRGGFDLPGRHARRAVPQGPLGSIGQLLLVPSRSGWGEHLRPRR